MPSRRRLAGTLVSLCVASAGCNSILGIEELSSGPRPGGSGGTSTSGGTSSSGSSNAQGGSGGAQGGIGGSNTQGGSGSGSGGSAGLTATGGAASSGASGMATTNGGGAGKGGSSSGGAVTASGGAVSTGGTTSVGGDAGAGGDAGGLDGGGSGGEGGSTGGTTFDGTVHGKIVNLWGYPQSGVTVTVSGVATSVTTGVDGSFTVSGVTAPYDVSFVVVATNGSGSPLATQAWLFKGLRRADPTLQTYRGGPENAANVTLSQTGAPSDSALKFACSVANPHGRMSRSMTSGGIAYASAPLSCWTGAEGMAHALSFYVGADGLPTSYSAHGTHALTLAAGELVTQAIDLTPPTTALRTGAVTGTVVSTGSGDRLNFAWLQFADHALIKLGEYVPTAAAFTYTVPELNGASVTVAANQGNQYQGPYAVVHENGLGIGANATLTLPTPATISTPLSGATVNSNTVFQWTGGGSVSVVRVQSTGYRWIYIVTGEHSTTIPSSLFQTLGIASGSALESRVESHGSVASVDEATGAQGFLDEFSAQDITPDSPTPGDGSFSFSKLIPGTFSP